MINFAIHLRSFIYVIFGFFVINLGMAEEKNQMNFTYEELICTEIDRATIFEIISTLGEKGKIQLLFKKTYLNQIGDSVRHVHPLKFLSVIILQPELKKDLRRILDDYFKRSGFMEEMNTSLSLHLAQGTLLPYLSDFCAEVGISYDLVQKYCYKKEWDKLIQFLAQ